MPFYRNSAEGGSDGIAVTTGNSGGLSGDAWSSVVLGTGSTIVYDDAQVSHGVLANLISPASSQTAYLRRDVEASVTQILLSFYVRFPSTPTATVELAHIRNATSDVALLQVTNAPLRFRVFPDNGAALFTSATIAANTWYRVELRAVRGTTTANGTIQFAYYIGDLTTPVETAFSSTTTDAGTTDLTNVRVGRPAAVADTTAHWVDSVQVATAGDAAALGLVWPVDNPAVPALVHIVPVAGIPVATAGVDVSDLQVPSPNVAGANQQVLITVTDAEAAAAGDYRIAASLLARVALLSGDTDFRGYAAEIARSRAGATELWELVLKRFDTLNTITELTSDDLPVADVQLPGTLTLTVSGTSIGATFMHAGAGGTMTISDTDATYTTGIVALLGQAVAGVGDFAQITADNFGASVS